MSFYSKLFHWSTNFIKLGTKIRNVLELRWLSTLFIKKSLKKLGIFRNNVYLCTVRMHILATPLSAGSKALQILLHLNKKAASCMVRLFYCSYFLRNCL